MRARPFLAAAAAVAALAAPQPASAAPPPHPSSCTATLEAVATPADPGGLVATGVVAVGAAEIVCTRDVLATPPGDYLAGWSGHITIYFQTPSGIRGDCAHGPDVFDAVGPVLVLAAVQHCFIPVSDPAHTQPLELVVHWATLAPGYYLCCQSKTVWATPVGIG